MMRAPTLILAMLFSGVLHASPATYRIDPEHFSIAFFVQHVGFAKVIGQFTEATGEFVYDEASNRLQGGVVEVRAASVFSNHVKRDAHVRDRDFLDADAHSVVRFVAKDFQPDTSAVDSLTTGTLRGDLTLLGQTHPVELKIQINKAASYPFGHRKHTLGVSASTTIQRSRWGMSYAVENGLVGDTVTLMFEFEALRQ